MQVIMKPCPACHRLFKMAWEPPEAYPPGYEDEDRVVREVNAALFHFLCGMTECLLTGTKDEDLREFLLSKNETDHSRD